MDPGPSKSGLERPPRLANQPGVDEQPSVFPNLPGAIPKGWLPRITRLAVTCRFKAPDGVRIRRNYSTWSGKLWMSMTQ